MRFRQGRYDEIDPIAALQHEIRDAAHDTAGLYGYLNGVRKSFEREYYTREEFLLHVEAIEERLRAMSAEFNRNWDEAEKAMARAREIGQTTRALGEIRQNVREAQWAESIEREALTHDD